MMTTKTIGATYVSVSIAIRVREPVKIGIPPSDEAYEAIIRFDSELNHRGLAGSPAEALMLAAMRWARHGG